MQSKSGRIKRAAAELEKESLFPPSNALPSYGSVGVQKEPLLEESKSVPATAKQPLSNDMSSRNDLRRITASEVVLPTVQWYRRLYIPLLMSRRPSPLSNAVHTTKYTILNFLPKNLWEQFHRWANIYFLLIALLNFIPAVEAVGKEVAFVPLLSILSVTIAKDIFEDYRRFKSDGEVNKKLCQVYDR